MSRATAEYTVGGDVAAQQESTKVMLDTLKVRSVIVHSMEIIPLPYAVALDGKIIWQNTASLNTHNLLHGAVPPSGWMERVVMEEGYTGYLYPKK